MGTKDDYLKFNSFCRKGVKAPDGDYTQMSACTAWVVYNENLDYLHCPDKLDWDKASSCKD